MDRAGQLLMIFGFLMLWSLPVPGTLVMVAGAVMAAINWEASMRASESAAIPSPVESKGAQRS